MKQLLFISLLFGLSISSFAQTQTNMIVDVSRSYSIESFTEYSHQRYGAFNLGLGAQFEKQWGSLDIKASYRLSTAKGGSEGAGEFQSHFLGGDIKYILLNKEKRFRPFVEFNIFKEVATNYKDGYLWAGNLTPASIPPKDYNGPIYSSIYQSTPYLFNFLLGCNVKIIENLNFSFAAGMGKREMIYKEFAMSSLPDRTKVSRIIELQIGLVYAFSFKKKV